MFWACHHRVCDHVSLIWVESSTSVHFLIFLYLPCHQTDRGSVHSPPHCPSLQHYFHFIQPSVHMIVHPFIQSWLLSLIPKRFQDILQNTCLTREKEQRKKGKGKMVKGSPGFSGPAMAIRLSLYGPWSYFLLRWPRIWRLPCLGVRDPWMLWKHMAKCLPHFYILKHCFVNQTAPLFTEVA